MRKKILSNSEIPVDWMYISGCVFMETLGCPSLYPSLGLGWCCFCCKNRTSELPKKGNRVLLLMKMPQFYLPVVLSGPEFGREI